MGWNIISGRDEQSISDAVGGGQIGQMTEPDRFNVSTEKMAPPEVAEWKAWWEKHKGDDQEADNQWDLSD